MPNWSCSIQLHILADTTVGMAQGTSIAARKSVRMREGWLSSSATPRPNSVSSATDSAAKTTVLRTECHQSPDHSKQIGRASCRERV